MCKFCLDFPARPSLQNHCQGTLREGDLPKARYSNYVQVSTYANPPKNQSLVLFNMRMHIWGLDGWQQWSSHSDFENLDFSLRVYHVVHSFGWIDLPVCGLKINLLEINGSCTFSKQMCYLTIGSASRYFIYPWVYIYIYFKVVSFQCPLCHHCCFYPGLLLAHCCFAPFA